MGYTRHLEPEPGLLISTFDDEMEPGVFTRWIGELYPLLIAQPLPPHGVWYHIIYTKANMTSFDQIIRYFRENVTPDTIATLPNGAEYVQCLSAVKVWRRWSPHSPGRSSLARCRFPFFMQWPMRSSSSPSIAQDDRPQRRSKVTHRAIRAYT